MTKHKLTSVIDQAATTVNKIDTKLSNLFDALLPTIAIATALSTIYLYADASLSEVFQSWGIGLGVAGAIAIWILFFYCYPVDELVDDPRSHETVTLFNALTVNFGTATAIVVVVTYYGFI